ncbi:histone H2A [Echinococcus multilocularis]|uniref:Histone H2A n=1 Tax=Echinococcus multilocularis TaxID=6211 RepID=A0A068Y3I4_ECHMU|nr:histone H2A [Echinococcus multilocularis]
MDYPLHPSPPTCTTNHSLLLPPIGAPPLLPATTVMADSHDRRKRVEANHRQLTPIRPPVNADSVYLKLALNSPNTPKLPEPPCLLCQENNKSKCDVVLEVIYSRAAAAFTQHPWQAIHPSTHSLRRTLAAEAVMHTTLALEGADHAHGSDGLALCVLVTSSTLCFDVVPVGLPSVLKHLPAEVPELPIRNDRKLNMLLGGVTIAQTGVLPAQEGHEVSLHHEVGWSAG